MGKLILMQQFRAKLIRETGNRPKKPKMPRLVVDIYSVDPCSGSVLDGRLIK